MSVAQSYQKPQTIGEAYQNPRYRGKIVIESPEGLYSTTKDEAAIKALRRLRAKYHSSQVVTTVIPRGVLVPMPAQVQ